MALSKEEISLRLGVDGRAISPGLAGASRQINKFASDSVKKLTSILKANVFIAAADLLRQLIPTAQEFWEKIYGADEESIRMADEAHQRIKNLAKQVRESRDSVILSEREHEFKKADPSKKILMTLEDRRQAILDQVEAQKDEEDQLKNLAALRARQNKLLEDQREIEASTPMDAQQIAKKLVELNSVKKKAYDIDQRLEKAANAHAEAIIKKNKAREDELKIEERLMGLKKNQPEQLGPHADSLEDAPVLKDKMMAGLSDYYRKVAAQFESYSPSTAGESEKYRKMSDAFYKGQKDAAAEFVQKVAIVEIKE
jgi:hypothetical protein